MAVNSTQTLKPGQSRFFAGIILRVLTALAGLLVCLSILSHHTKDEQMLYEGTDSPIIFNWIGRLGAWISYHSFLWIGLAVYPTMLLLMACVSVRLFAPAKVRAVSGSYFAGMLLTVSGFSMLFGVFPGFMSRVCVKLNLAQTAGGAFGNRLCAPDSGLMSFVVNPTGSVIIAVTMALLGLLAIWYFDWQALSIEGWHKFMARMTAAPKEAPTADPTIINFSDITDDVEEKQEEKPIPETIKEVFEDPPPSITRKAAKPAVAKAAVAIETEEAVEAVALPAEDRYKDYRLPSIKLLNELSNKTTAFDPKEINAKKGALQQTLESFGIDASVGNATCGPRVTLFEIKPAPGVKVEKISNLQNNIKMNLRAESMRILTPIPGKDSVGIEVPNSKSSDVLFRELLQSSTWKDFKGALPVCLGKDISGKPVILDLGKAPHLLIAGATGSGKSVCMNALIMSLLYRFKPDELKMIMIDPKVVEFSGYSELPHLVAPVINEVGKVPIVLNWAVGEMERRYRMLSKVGVRNLASFNARKPESPPVMDDDGKPIPARLPYVVLIIDELADIMMTAKQEVETLLARIAQMARAIGIHAVIATQRPSVNVITGVIKANFPTRIAFRVTSLTDSRTIIDGKGAETLLGYGDMLFKSPSGSKLERVQGCFLADDEIERAVEFMACQADADLADDIFKTPDIDGEQSGGGAGDGGGSPRGPVNMNENGFADSEEALILQAIQVIVRDKRATTSHIQRRMRIGYNRASLIIEELERRGIVGPQIGSAPRDILITDEDLQQYNLGDDDDPGDAED